MKTDIVKILTGAALAVALATSMGCVSKSMFDEHVAANDASIKAAAQDAAAAKAAADAAAASASSAANAANAAQSTSNQALQAAQGAQACCDATNEKIDRAFKKSMGKYTPDPFVLRTRTPRQPRGVFFTEGFPAAAAQRAAERTTARERRCSAGTRALPRSSRPLRCDRQSPR